MQILTDHRSCPKVKFLVQALQAYKKQARLQKIRIYRSENISILLWVMC